MQRVRLLISSLLLCLLTLPAAAQSEDPVPKGPAGKGAAGKNKAAVTDQTEFIRKSFDDVGKHGVIYLPKGVYDVTDRLFTIVAGRRITLRGDGMGQTIIRLAKDIDGALIHSTGEKGKMSSYLVVEDITLHGDGHAGDAMRLEGIMWSNFRRVEFRSFRGQAVLGLSFWDSLFDDCHFVDCGDPAKDRAVVDLQNSNPGDYYTCSNNITFMGCRWEANKNISMRIGPGSRKNRLVSCKFHGTLPEPQPFSHLVMDDADANVITACNFTNGGKSAIVLGKSHGNIIAENVIGTNPEYGVHLIDSHSNSISLNSFSATAREKPNAKGAWFQEGESKANKFEGNVGNTRTVADGQETPTGNVVAGSGPPEGKVSAEVGTLYLNTDSSGARAYLKQTGIGKNGWKALK